MKGEKDAAWYASHYYWIDWLRIICMIWIILFHFCDYTTIKMSDVELSPSWVVLAFSKLGGGIGNCIFAMISGYLLCEKKFQPKRLVKLWLEIAFYSYLSFFIAVALQAYSPNSIPELVRNFIPITGIRYWYATVYFFIYLMHPLFNIIIKKINIKLHIGVILILLYFCSAINTVSDAQVMNSGGGVEIFITMYFLGALIRKYELFKKPARYYAFALLGSLLLMSLSEIFLKMQSIENFAYFVWPMKRLPVIFAAFLLFIFLKNVKWKTNKIVSACAQSTFAVYLIHIGVLQKFWFENMFDIAWVYGKPYFAPAILLYAITLFVICVIIDRLRLNLVEKQFWPMIERKLFRKEVKAQ